MINRTSRIFAFIVLMLGFLAISNGMKAQKVVRNGNTFVQQSGSSQKSSATKTEFTYTDSKGNVDTIYISSTGKAFVFKVSKKTGNTYRKYLPEVTKQLEQMKQKK